MKACMVAYTFYESDNRVRRYAEALVKNGAEVDAIVLGQEGQPRFDVISGVRVHRVQTRVRNERGPLSYLKRLLMFFLRSAWAVTMQHMKGRYDIIHVHSVPDFEVFATIVPRLMGTPVILDIHDIVPEFYASKFNVAESSVVFRLMLLMEKLSAAYASHVIIANDLWHTKITRRSVDPAKCTAMINYPDLSIFSRRPRPEPDNGDFVMCYPGTLNSHQGVDLAIGAVAILRERVPNLKLVIIGDGPDRQKLTDAVKEQRLEDRVSIVGLIPMEQVAKTLAAVDLGVVPKRKDSFGNEAFSTKIMEFMSMNVPVVVSRTKIDEYYFDSSLVEFFDSGNSQDLADKVLDLIRNPVKRNALRDQATEFIRHNNWDVKKDQYLGLVNRLRHRLVPRKYGANPQGPSLLAPE